MKNGILRYDTGVDEVVFGSGCTRRMYAFNVRGFETLLDLYRLSHANHVSLLIYHITIAPQQRRRHGRCVGE